MPAINLKLPARDLSPDALVWLLALGGLVPIIWLLVHNQFNLLAVVFFLLPLLVILRYSKENAIYLTLIFLLFLGDIRRAVATAAGGFPKLDPLLLVGPAIAVVMAVPLLMRVRLKDSISKAVFAFTIVVFLEIFNPKQGPISVGLGGAMFYLIPLLWFWVGRQYGTPQLLERLIYRLVIPIGLIAAFLGVYQTYVGFLPWESAWIESAGYESLHVGAYLRSFGFSVNAIEYINLLLLATVCCVGAFFSGRRVYGILIPFFGIILFLASSRASIVRVLFAISAAWALSSKGGKGWAVRLPIGVMILFGVLAFVIGRAAGPTNPNESAHTGSFVGDMTYHQVEGLANPLDPNKSTAKLHSWMIMVALREGFAYPIGRGTGYVTSGAKLNSNWGEKSAATQFDEDKGFGSSEYDIPDAFLAFGPIGGILYTVIIYLVVRRAILFGRSMPHYLGLPMLAMLAGMAGSLVPLGQYALGPLIWFLIGMLARYKEPAAQPAIAPRSVSAQPTFRPAIASASHFDR